MKTSAVVWPAIVKLHAEQELLFVSDNAEWSSDPDNYAFSYDSLDRLIDSSGNTFGLNTFENGVATPSPTGKVCETTELTIWIKDHLSVQGICCLEKFRITDIPSAILLVRDSE